MSRVLCFSKIIVSANEIQLRKISERRAEVKYAAMQICSIWPADNWAAP